MVLSCSFAKANPRFCKRRCFILIQFYERFTFLSPVLCNHTLRATSIRRYILGLLVYFLTPSLISFIGLLPRFVFFVKVPFRSSENNHFHVPPLTFFASTPTSRRHLRVRRVSFRSCTLHIVPPSSCLSFAGHVFRVFCF